MGFYQPEAQRSCLYICRQKHTKESSTRLEIKSLHCSLLVFLALISSFLSVYLLYILWTVLYLP